MAAPSSNNDYRTTNAQALLVETRAVGVALAGLAFGCGIGIVASALLCAAGADSIQCDSVGFTCLAGSLFTGFTLAVGFSVRLKAALDRLSSLEEGIMARLVSITASNSAPPAFGKAVTHARVARYPTPQHERAEKETAALLERFMLPRKDES